MFCGTCLKTNRSGRSIKTTSCGSRHWLGFIISKAQGLFWFLSCEIKASASWWEGLRWMLQSRCGALGRVKAAGRRWSFGTRRVKLLPVSSWAANVNIFKGVVHRAGQACAGHQMWWHLVFAGSFCHSFPAFHDEAKSTCACPRSATRQGSVYPCWRFQGTTSPCATHITKPSDKHSARLNNSLPMVAWNVDYGCSLHTYTTGLETQRGHGRCFTACAGCLVIGQRALDHQTLPVLTNRLWAHKQEVGEWERVNSTI